MEQQEQAFHLQLSVYRSLQIFPQSLLWSRLKENMAFFRGTGHLTHRQHSTSHRFSARLVRARLAAAEADAWLDHGSSIIVSCPDLCVRNQAPGQTILVSCDLKNKKNKDKKNVTFKLSRSHINFYRPYYKHDLNMQQLNHRKFV